MDPRRFQDLARFLHDDGPESVDGEACVRGACGRAYYAAFGYASELLRAIPLEVPDSGEAHAVVPELLKGSDDPLIRLAGSDLERLLRNRNSADYDVGSVPPRKWSFDPATSKWAVERAGTIIERLQAKKGTDVRLGIPP